MTHSTGKITICARRICPLYEAGTPAGEPSASHGLSSTSPQKKQAPETAPANEVRKRPSSAYFSGRALKNQEVEFAFTDLKNPVVVGEIEDFEKMLEDLKNIASEKGAKVGLMFIPSKVQLIYQITQDRDIL